jgi:hypothetical protein
MSVTFLSFPGRFLPRNYSAFRKGLMPNCYYNKKGSINGLLNLELFTQKANILGEIRALCFATGIGDWAWGWVFAPEHTRWNLAAAVRPAGRKEM